MRLFHERTSKLIKNDIKKNNKMELKMNFQSIKKISSKSIVMATTLTLSLSYIGLVVIYAEGVANDLTAKTESYGRNDTKSLVDLEQSLVLQDNPEYILKLKSDLEKQLRQANLMLNVIESKSESSKRSYMN